MGEKENTISLIQTKLNRPLLPVDLVRRPHLAGLVIDQAALFGVINVLSDIRLPLISVEFIHVI